MTLLEWLIHGTIPVPGGELGVDATRADQPERERVPA